MIVTLGDSRQVYSFDLYKTCFPAKGQRAERPRYSRVRELYGAIDEALSEQWVQEHAHRLAHGPWRVHSTMMYRITQEQLHDALTFAWSQDREHNRLYSLFYSCFHFAAKVADKAHVSVRLRELYWFARAAADVVITRHSKE